MKRSVGLTASIVAAILILAALAFVVRVPEGRIAVAGRPGSGTRRLSPGLHLRIPFLEPSIVFPAEPISVEGKAMRVSPEGATIEIPYRFRLSAPAASPDTLLGRARDGDLAAAGRRAVETALRDLETPTSVGPEQSRVFESALEPLGLIAGSLVIEGSRPGTRERSFPLATLRSSYGGPRFPVLLIGIDGADWDVMGPLIDHGALPALRDLKERGAWGVLRSSIPTLSPLLWTTIATGKTPDQHGIVDFLVKDPASGREVPISSRLRRSRALWSILSDLGVPSLTVGWWATWPAEKVAGAMISDRLAYSLLDTGAGPVLEDAGWPPEAAAAARRLVVAPESITFEEVRRIVEIGRQEFDAARSSLGKESSWRDPVAHLIRVLAATRTYHRVATDRLRDGQPALTLVYYEGLDEVNHRFAHYAEPAMRWADPSKVPAFRHAVENFYRFQDGLVADLIAAVDPNTVTIVVSDHGVATGDERPTDVPPDIEGKPGRWHTLDGVILSAGPPVQPGRLAKDPALLDVAPTILALLSLPRAEDMPGRVVPEIAPQGSLPAPPVSSIATYEAPGGAPSTEGSALASPADAEMIAKLTALGYVGSPQEAPGSSPESGTTGATGAIATVTGHVNAGNVLVARGKFREAEPEYRAALSLGPAFVPARLGLAQCLIATGREAEGWKEMRAALTRGDDLDPATYLKVARFYRRQKKVAEGAELFASLPRREGLEAARLTARALLLLENGDFASAGRDLKKALREDPAFPEALQETYFVLTRRSEYDDLIAILERAMEIRPGGVRAANLLALTYERAGRMEDAKGVLSRLLQSSPRDVSTLTNLAGMLIRQGDAAAAVPLLERAREVDPSNVEAIINLVVAQGKLHNLSAAREAYASAGAAASRIELLNAMAYACYLNGDLREAKELVDRSLSRNPDQGETRRLLEVIEGAARAPSSAQGPGL